ncbi:MAG: hypothetical protein AAGA55_10880 [Planctomycetota bacterium]
MTDEEAANSTPQIDEAPEPLPLPVLIGMVTVCSLVLLSAIAWGTLRLLPEKSYATDTPRAVLASAAEMLEDGRADRLVELIETVPPAELGTERDGRMQDLFIRLGRVLRAAQELHVSIEAEMPDELADLKSEMAAAEARGDSASLIGALIPGRRGRDRSPEQREARERIIEQLLADPFAEIDRAVGENIDRVGFQEIGADSVAITWDARPVLPPFGLMMRDSEEGWRIVPPTSLLMVRRFLPDTDAEYQVWGSLLATVESLLDDLRRDVAGGRIRSLDKLTQQAIEDAIIPMGMMMVALGNADEED